MASLANNTNDRIDCKLSQKKAPLTPSELPGQPPNKDLEKLELSKVTIMHAKGRVHGFEFPLSVF